MGLIDRLQTPLSFGCFLMFEIWESDKERLPTSTNMDGEMERLVRVVLNPCPFQPPHPEAESVNAADLPVHTDESVILAEVDVKEMQIILRRIQGHFMKKGLSMSRSGRLMLR
jgi:hypothetical protein